MVDKVFDLFSELGATDAQMDFQIVYASGMNGIAGIEPDKLTENLQPLFQEILKLPKAKVNGPLRVTLYSSKILHDACEFFKCVVT